MGKKKVMITCVISAIFIIGGSLTIYLVTRTSGIVTAHQLETEILNQNSKNIIYESIENETKHSIISAACIYYNAEDNSSDNIAFCADGEISYVDLGYVDLSEEEHMTYTKGKKMRFVNDNSISVTLTDEQGDMHKFMLIFSKEDDKITCGIIGEK